MGSYTLQNEVDNAGVYEDIEPILAVAGSAFRATIRAANDTMNAICGTSFPQKWNEINIPPFYTNSWQQDYAVVYPAGTFGRTLVLTAVANPKAGTAVYTGVIFGGDFNAYVNIPFTVAGFANSVNNGVFVCVASTSTTLTLKNASTAAETHAGTAISAPASINNLSWLERGVCFDINNTSIPKPYGRVETGRSLPQRTGAYGNGSMNFTDPVFIVNWFPNRSLYFGVWGADPLSTQNTGGGTLGNNPQAGSVYTPPLGAISQPSNPITQIIDANGNFLLLTTYGTEGNAAPLAARGAQPGTQVSGSGATTVWTVLDPNGYGFRIDQPPSQTGSVFQFVLTGQAKPVQFVSLSQTLDPLPDELEPHFFQGFITQLLKYSSQPKVRQRFVTEWPLWLKSIENLRIKQDREQEEYMFQPERTVMGSARSRNTYRGAGWPFNYPRM